MLCRGIFFCCPSKGKIDITEPNPKTKPTTERPTNPIITQLLTSPSERPPSRKGSLNNEAPPRPHTNPSESSLSRQDSLNNEAPQTPGDTTTDNESARSPSTISNTTVDFQPPKLSKNTKRRSGVVPRPVTFDETNVKHLPVIKKEPHEENLIREAILNNDFLSNITKEGKRLENLINAMHMREVKRDEIVIKQGDIGTEMYVSCTGTYEIIIDGLGMVDTFSDARVFGELALLHNASRLATIKSCTEGKIWVLNQEDYMNIMLHTNLEEQEEKMDLLLKVQHVNQVSPEALQAVAKLLKTEFFKAGDVIVKEGEQGDKFYIIRAGYVSVTKKEGGRVNTLKKGDYFGERALLKGGIREATVSADVPVECLTLTREHFQAHFGDIQNWGDIQLHEGERAKISIQQQPEMEHADLELNDFNMVATLGVGGFGRVELVHHKTDSKLIFALKYLKKIDIKQQQQKEHVLNEKAMQMACRSSFIVRMFRTYKDTKYFYFLMESCLGGDLWSLLQKQPERKFQEGHAKFIAGCVLEAINYLHERGIVYRDLKPENLMIDKTGYVKLTDFGFAKKLKPGRKTNTFAGTPEYVAPEIVLNRGHDKAVDYWAFGIFIYELLVGRTPFRTGDPNHIKTYNCILRGIDSVKFPSHVPNKAKHIVVKLCRPMPSERLGCLRGGIKEIKGHKWFSGFDWNKLNSQQIQPHFVPKLKHPTDTRYFDKFHKDTDFPPDVTFEWEDEF